MGDGTNQCVVKPFGSLKPINSVLALKVQNTDLVLVGFGNELRIYSQDFSVVHDQLTFHDSHHIYGIQYGETDGLAAIYGLGRVVWCSLQVQESSPGAPESLNEMVIRCVEAGRLDEYDLFLECYNYARGKWLVGSSTGKLRLCPFDQQSHETASQPLVQSLVAPQSPTLYCMRISVFGESTEAMIVSGSAFSTVNVSVLDLGRESITQEQVLKAHNGVVYDVRVSGDGVRLISSSDDRKIVVWMREEEVREMSDCPIPLKFSPRYVLVGHEANIWSVDCLWEKGLIASVSEDGSLFVWDLNRTTNDKSPCPVGEGCPECIGSPEAKVLKAHQGRGGRIVRSVKDEQGYWTFITGGEGGDLKVWKYATQASPSSQDGETQLSHEDGHFSFSESRILPTDCYRPSEVDKSSTSVWYQGVHLVDQDRLIGVTRQGGLSIGTKTLQNAPRGWETTEIQDLGDHVYSMSCLDSGHLVLGSSRGKIMHGLVSSATKKMEMRQEVHLPSWTENVTFIHYFDLVEDELYLALSSCSRGFVGASVTQKTLEDFGGESSRTWRTSVLPIKGTPKYGELKCVDILKHNDGSGGTIVCGTVSGNIFTLDFKILRKEGSLGGSHSQEDFGEKLSLEIGLSNVLSSAHKGNVSSLSWINDSVSYGLLLQSTGQDGKINQYSVQGEIRLEWSHRWNSQCEYIVRCFNLGRSNDWLVIGALKHELFLYLAKDSVTSTPVLLLRHKFGGIKRSFQISVRRYSSRDILEVVWCQKPSIRIDQLDITNLLEGGQTFLKGCSATRLSIAKSFGSDSPSRLTYSSAWMTNSIVILGGEDHIVRLYDVSDSSQMSLIQSIRLLDPIRKLKVLSIREDMHILMITGGRQTFHMFEIRQDKSRGDIAIKTIFSNDCDKKRNNSRFISLDYILSPICPGKTAYKLLVLVGSSKGEILTFSFRLLDLGERMDLKLERAESLGLPFVPFSLAAKDFFGAALVLAGLSNGSIYVLRSSNPNLSSDDFSLGLALELEIKPHSSGVNSVLLLDGNLCDSQIAVSAGHDQKISVLRITLDRAKGNSLGEIVSSIPNAHFSSIRDICYDPTDKVLYSVSWDQTLKLNQMDEQTLSLTKVGQFQIPTWDSSKFSLPQK